MKANAYEARVGIFWLVAGSLLFDTTPLSAAEAHLHFRIHPGDHVTAWKRLQQQGLVPGGMEYDQPPRGRVAYDSIDEQFTLLADNCILGDKRIVGEIIAAMNLPDGTATAADEHYRCQSCLPCLYGKDDDEHGEEPG